MGHTVVCQVTAVTAQAERACTAGQLATVTDMVMAAADGLPDRQWTPVFTEMMVMNVSVEFLQ